MQVPLPISIVCLNGGDLHRARTFSKQHSFPLLDHIETTLTANIKSSCATPYGLCYSAQGVALFSSQNKSLGHAITCDFSGGKNNHRRKFSGGKKQLLAKAVGVSSRSELHVLDATAGLGRDAFVLASLGCTVTLLERSVIVHELLRSGLDRARLAGESDLLSVLDRMNLVHTDAKRWLAQQPADCVDVVYLDPMFPQREKTALVKKEMRYFHEIVGSDDDAGELLHQAREKAAYRVVVKRAAKSPYLADIKPTYEIDGKSSRYDIYVNLSMSKTRFDRF
ncbi:MAG: hypothetical protein CSA50_05825 [Gammaproteobacteria bacterium]|nr:MAG: hypothetical protein CSA50_05825 [Gammaproteobacteria bacterium]